MAAEAFQTITYSILDKKATPDIICRYGELGRFVEFRHDPEEFDINSASFDSIQIRIFKPDGNFYVKDLDWAANDSNNLVLVFDDEQITAAPGVARYDIAWYTDGIILYSCEGKMIIDTPIMGEDTIESVSVINGLIFPDDFQQKLTAGENIYISDDNVISATGGGGGGGSYVGGNYITIINDVIDVATSLINTINGKQDTLTPGTYLTIANGVIDVATSLINTINGKQAALTTGTYIDIVSNVVDVNQALLDLIAAKEDSFTTGDYVSIVNGVLDVTSGLISTINGKQDQLTAGTYMDITNGVIDVATSLINTINGKQAALSPGSYISIVGSTIDVASGLITTINGKQDALTAGTGIEIVSNVVGLTQAIQDTINSKIDISMLAAEYDEDSTYSENDFATINGALYMCNTDINPAHAYDPAEWTAATTIMPIITQLINSADGLASDVSALQTLMGTTSISSIGDGSVTGAISTLNSSLTDLIKDTDVTGTTDTNGNLSISNDVINRSTNKILSVIPIRESPYYTSFYYADISVTNDNSTYLLHCSGMANEVLASKSIKVKCVYV